MLLLTIMDYTARCTQLNYDAWIWWLYQGKQSRNTEYLFNHENQLNLLFCSFIMAATKNSKNKAQDVSILLHTVMTPFWSYCLTVDMYACVTSGKTVVVHWQVQVIPRTQGWKHGLSDLSHSSQTLWHFLIGKIR